MNVETILDQGSGLVNEDSLLEASPVFGVFDGASGMEPYMSDDGKTGALIASSTAVDVFSTREKPLTDLVIEANDLIRKKMEVAKIDQSRKTSLWATSGVAIRVGDAAFEWVQVGDCFGLIISKTGSWSILSPNDNHDLETLIMWQGYAKEEREDIRSLLHDQLVRVRNKSNIDFGSLNGDSAVSNFLRHGTLSLSDAAHILLFSDGMLLPKEDPRSPDDFEKLVQLYLQGGLKNVRDYVRNVEGNDPQCWKYPRLKQYDDIGAIALSF